MSDDLSDFARAVLVQAGNTLSTGTWERVAIERLAEAAIDRAADDAAARAVVQARTDSLRCLIRDAPGMADSTRVADHVVSRCTLELATLERWLRGNAKGDA